jgi:AAA15 family ATPase/GTPase
MKVTVKNFKGIESAEVLLDDITVFVGANNAGKSSFIQAIQFAVSGCQTLQLHKTPWRDRRSVRSTSFNSDEFLYTPTNEIENLNHNERLTEGSEGISVTFDDSTHLSVIEFKKGRNKGINTKLYNYELGQKLCSLEEPFCVYVPGIAGIPLNELYEPQITVRKSAVRGDSNNYLRNILLRISNEESKWNRFINSMSNVYDDIEIVIGYDENLSEYINCKIKVGDKFLPIDSVGTGVLQTMQIFAYMEYFNPTILLLDEPDSHLHPTKQRLLATEIQNRSLANTDMKVVFSTHSMQLLRHLNDVKTFHFIKGKPTQTDDESAILLDIGALDADYLFSKPNLRYVIITEDTVDNIKEKKNFIKQFLIANGLNENEFVLHSYNGCKNMHTANVLQSLVQKHLPSAEVIVHIDRDQRWNDDDPELQILISKANTHNIKLFITEGSEIENYFCSSEHLHLSYGKPLNDVEDIRNEALADLTDLCYQKLKDFILNDRITMVTKDNRLKSELLEELADKVVANFKEIIIPGKELLSLIKQKLVERYAIGDASIVVQPTPGLKSALFESILNS